MPMALKPQTVRWARTSANRLQVGATREKLGQQQIEVRFGAGFANASQIGEALREIEMLLNSPASFQPDMEPAP